MRIVVSNDEKIRVSNDEKKSQFYDEKLNHPDFMGGIPHRVSPFLCG